MNHEDPYSIHYDPHLEHTDLDDLFANRFAHLSPKTKKYRFYFHYNKQHKKLSVHYRGKCLLTKAVRITVPTESKQNKQQPLITIQGWCTNLKHTDKLTIIS